MSRRNYRELWEWLKVLVLCSGRRRLSPEDILEVMVKLELFQLPEDNLELPVELPRVPKNGGVKK